jgi:hypothetical protein
MAKAARGPRCDVRPSSALVAAVPVRGMAGGEHSLQCVLCSDRWAHLPSLRFPLCVILLYLTLPSPTHPSSPTVLLGLLLQLCL